MGILSLHNKILAHYPVEFLLQKRDLLALFSQEQLEKL